MEKQIETLDFLSMINTSGLIPPDITKALSGGITGVSVNELFPKTDSNNNVTVEHIANLIIRTDHEWEIVLEWKLTGTMLDSKFLVIPGNWVVKAFLEGWGTSAEDYDLPEINQKVELYDANNKKIKSPWEYKVTINPGKIPVGTYRLAVALTYVDENNLPGPLAGFIEFPDMIQIYNPGK